MPNASTIGHNYPSLPGVEGPQPQRGRPKGPTRGTPEESGKATPAERICRLQTCRDTLFVFDVDYNGVLAIDQRLAGILESLANFAFLHTE